MEEEKMKRRLWKWRKDTKAMGEKTYMSHI
jgi:hypothetical protein